jgi:hypothetical protein
MVGFARSDDPEHYDGGSEALHRVSRAGEVKCDDPDKEEHPGPPGWGLGVGQTMSLIKYVLLRSF